MQDYNLNVPHLFNLLLCEVVVCSGELGGGKISTAVKENFDSKLSGSFMLLVYFKCKVLNMMNNVHFEKFRSWKF